MPDSPTVAQELVRHLRAAGSRHIFGAAGPSLFDVIDAVGQEPGVDYVFAQTELGAAHMAEAYAKATRSFGVCLAGASGATNLLEGLAYAAYSSTPVVALVDEGAAPADAVRPFVKAVFRLASASDAVAVLANAIAAAATPPRGPVWLAIAEGVLAARIPAASPLPPGRDWAETPHETRGIADGPVEQVGARLAAVERPVVFVGDDVFWAGLEAEALALAETVGAGILTARSQKGLIPEDHPLSLGCLGATELRIGPDLILAFGDDSPPPVAEVLRLTPRDLPLLLSSLRSPGPGVRSDVDAHKAAWRREREGKAAASGGDVINQWRFYQELAKQLSPEMVVVSPDTRWLIQGLESPSKVYLRAFGHGLSAALAVKLAQPDRPVVCITGDGSVMMELQELITVARVGLPLPVFVTRNLAFGALKREQERRFDGRSLGTDVWAPDLGALAPAFGAAFFRAERTTDLPAAIASALQARKPALVDVVCPSDRD